MIMLNDEQRSFIMHVLHCFKTNQLPLKIALSGSAGVGKTLVIKAIQLILTAYFNELPDANIEKTKILLCAPTGLAAFLINGLTLHTAFALPVNQFGGQMPELSEEIANTIRGELFYLKLLIIDEFSMVGSNMFSRIDTRLKQIMGRNEPFGGISVILVGDLNQLPPVNDFFIFLPPKITNLSIFSGNILWEEFKFFELTKIMRQQNDSKFITALNNLASGKMTNDDISLINLRRYDEKNIPDDAIRLFWKNNDVNEFNTKKIKILPGIIYKSISKDYIYNSENETEKEIILCSLKSKDRRECGGLSYELLIKINVPYMITTNINIEDGLVNGAYGVLKHITFQTLDKEPLIAWIKFDNNKIGIKIRTKYKQFAIENNIDSDLVPILKIDSKINLKKNVDAYRQQFPLTPAEALTIHKSQGQTFNKVCVKLDKKRKLQKSLMYVSFSRVRKLEDLYIIGNFVPPNESTNNTLELEIKNLRENKKLEFSYTKKIKGNKLIIIYQNVRSICNNLKFIKIDKWYYQGNLLIFSETQSLISDNFHIDGFEILHRFDNKIKRMPKGLICFVRDKTKYQILKEIEHDFIINNSNCHIYLLLIKIEEIYILTGYKSPSIKKSTFLNCLVESKIDDYLKL